jgi:antitoxin component YwqK of YwqJK toxin-antitoxin module
MRYRLLIVLICWIPLIMFAQKKEITKKAKPIQKPKMVLEIPDSLKDGSYKSYFPNSQKVQKEENFVNGKRHGETWIYFEMKKCKS